MDAHVYMKVAPNFSWMRLFSGKMRLNFARCACFYIDAHNFG